MLLARKGYKVLAVDRATFPSDTMSTHQVQITGGVLLKRWGLLDKVLATGCPPARRVKMDMGPLAIRGTYPALEGVDFVHSPRRTLLDKILVDAAVEAGAEVREGFSVDEILTEDGRVTGIRGRGRGGATVTEKARIVVGADGRHSLVAGAVQPATYNERPPLTCAYYTYFADLPLEGGEMYPRERRAIGAWPTNDGLTMIYTAWPIEEFHRYRADIEGNFLKTVGLVPSLAERVHAARRAERFMGTADLPNFYRKPYGPGWALVGDAGYHKDPITGLGISDAFRDADLLAEAIDAGFSGRKPLDGALAGYEQARNTASKPRYNITLQLASFTPPVPEQVQRALFAALTHNQAAADRFFGALTGSVPMEEFFAPGNLFRILGLAGFARVALQRMGHRRQRERPAEEVAS
jgi:2-polyprenyl-6-methoxyphenol hydroxylase-like FAD-dependent oxidoreductase